MPRRPFRVEDATWVLQQATQGLPGTVGVQMTDLISGRSAGLSPTASFYGASTLKVPIAMAVLRLVDQNRLSLYESIAYQPEDFQAGTGSLQATIQVGDRIPVIRLLDLLITISDNIARNMLERHIGSGTIRNYMLSIGIAPPYDPVARTATPEGMNRALVALDTGQSGLSRESTRLLLGWMQNTVHRDRIPRYLPQGVVVANKIGSWPEQFHDIGLVYAPGRSFSIAVFTKGMTEAAAEEAIGRIASEVYWFEDWLAKG